MLSRSNILFQLVSLLALLPFQAAGQRGEAFDFSVSPTPVGSGARAAGMANAFVAIADDATAASWNPAGLVQLERPELSIVGSYNYIRERLHADQHPEFDVWNTSDQLELNYFSFVYPLPLQLGERNVTISISFQRKYEFDRVLEFDFDTYRRVGAVFRNVRFEQRGSLSAFSPAIAVEVTNRFAVGLSLNLWHSSILGSNSWEQKTEIKFLSFLQNTPGLTRVRKVERYEDFKGENLTLGFLWNATHRFNIGMRYDTGFEGDVTYKSQSSAASILVGSSILPLQNLRQKEQRQVRFPESVAIGVSHRPNDRFTWSLDITRTEWDDFYVRKKGGDRRSLVDGRSLNDLLVAPRFDPTYNLRFGVEYVFLPKPDAQYEILPRIWSIRGGAFFDQEPSSGRTTGFTVFNRGDGDPDDYYGLAVGAGLLARQRFNIDLAYQVRYGTSVNNDLIRGVPGFTEDLIQHRFLASTTIYF